MGKGHNTTSLSNDQIARRKLLQMAAYVPPAILGVMITGNKIAEAAQGGIGSTQKCKTGVITVSAGGSACCPCVPGDPKYNATTCNMERCQLGNCPSCGQLVFPSQGNCNAVASGTPCPCTCTQMNVPGGGQVPGGAGAGGGGAWWTMTGC